MTATSVDNRRRYGISREWLAGVIVGAVAAFAFRQSVKVS